MKNFLEIIKKKENVCQVCYPNCNSCSCFSICFPTSASTDILSKIYLKEKQTEIKELSSKHEHKIAKTKKQIEIYH